MTISGHPSIVIPHFRFLPKYNAGINLLTHRLHKQRHAHEKN